MMEQNNSDCDDDVESNVNISNNCPCCKQNFKYRFELVNHLEAIHNRSIAVYQLFNALFLHDLGFNMFIDYMGHLSIIYNQSTNFRCSKCQFKFETRDDLLTHQRIECGRGDYVDDDNLSISGDEDVSTLNDTAEDHLNLQPVLEKEKITIDTDRLQESAKNTFHFEQVNILAVRRIYRI